MTDQPTSEARERVLDTAEKLFMERGYDTVKLKHIADALDMKQASLYYHVPGGKEELFIAVLERNAERHYQGLSQALRDAEANLEDQLRAAARWFLSQPQVNIGRMLQSDLQAVAPEKAGRLLRVIYEAFMNPIETLLAEAEARGEIHIPNMQLISGTFLTMIQSLHNIRTEWVSGSNITPYSMADDLIRVLLNGLRPR
jgi:TetR/AcrR family transcriptional regulator, cholesterol catabolism regulator